MPRRLNVVEDLGGQSGERAIEGAVGSIVRGKEPLDVPPEGVVAGTGDREPCGAARRRLVERRFEEVLDLAPPCVGHRSGSG